MITATEAKDAAADEAAASKEASVDAAQSVAEAVKRVADAAVAAVQKQPVTGSPVDFQFSGSLGGRFTINGTGLGSSGTVKIGDLQLNTREWSTTHIEGDLPANAPKGEVTVHIDDKTVRRGVFK